MKKLKIFTIFLISFFVSSLLFSGEKQNQNKQKTIPRIVPKARIMTIVQYRYEGEDSPLGEMGIELRGFGFGTSFTGKKIMLGTHALAVVPPESSSSSVYANLKPDILFGETYDVYLAENGVKLSNIKKHLLKVYLSPHCSVKNDGSYFEYKGSPGCKIPICGAYFGPRQSSFVVRFGTAAAKILKWNNTRIDIKCPKLPPGRYKVYLEKNGKNVTMYHGIYFTILRPKLHKKHFELKKQRKNEGAKNL